MNKEEFIEKMKSCFADDDVIKTMADEQEKTIKFMENDIFQVAKEENVEDMAYKDIRILATEMTIQGMESQVSELKKRLENVN